jgi:hypothetical protein
MNDRIKVPVKDGLAEARKKLKDLRQSDPSPELVKIIDEVTRDKKPRQRDDIAALPLNPELEA